MAMEFSQFDATVGGAEHLPFSANSFKFAVSRSVEIAAMSESILRPSKTKLIFQTLPVHMRRRVMSHNQKRLPRKLREGHIEQLRKSGLPPKQKRPSRKYRRRPANLLKEYNRRQRRNIWLETHIWHAKRFHMIERWGYRLPERPCDKAFRACYRASSAHCLLQDISYYIPVQVVGPVDMIAGMFNRITNKSCGLTVNAKAYIEGRKEGTVHIFNPDSYPLGYIGKVQFIWVENDESKKELWLFAHPSQIKEIESVFQTLTSYEPESSAYEHEKKKRKICGKYSDIKVNIMTGKFNRFRLIGPKSHAVLNNTIKCITNLNNLPEDSWISHIKNLSLLQVNLKYEYWENAKLANSPSLLPPNVVIGLIIKDPRLSRPSYRTKAQNNDSEDVNIASLVESPPYLSYSPLWNPMLHQHIKQKQMTNGQFIEHITKTQLVPGEINENDPVLQNIPVVLIQRPGSQVSNYKRIGYGSGWDIIMPAGYAMSFWQTFVMFGARCGGLRESRNLSFEMSEINLPPDSTAGNLEEKRIEQELREKYFCRPPSKRVNYQKIAINSPFICPWKILLSDWSGENVDDFFVLRDKKIINDLQNCITAKKAPPHIDKAVYCLVAVCLQMIGKGNLKQHALVCLPQQNDIENIRELFEPLHEDNNEKLRKEKRKQHRLLLKQLKKKRRKLKKKSNMVKIVKHKLKQTGLSEYVKSMRELWLPSNISTVRETCSRSIIGYVCHGAFSFTEGISIGNGFIAFNALVELLKSRQDKVIVRNISSRKYHLAQIQVIQNV